MPFILLGEDELRQAVNLAEAIEAVETAFRTSAVVQEVKQTDFRFGFRDSAASVRSLAVYREDTPYYVIKNTNHFPNNPSINLPPQREVILICDAATGYPAAILTDTDYLTRLRFGAIASVATKHLANEQLERVAIVGSGDQAYMQLKMHMLIRNIDSVVVWDESEVKRVTYAQLLMEEHNIDVQVTGSLQAAVEGADLIVIVASDTTAQISAAWLRTGVHITLVNSSNTPKPILHPDVYALADLTVVNDRVQVLKTGGLRHALDVGTVTEDDVQPHLGEIIAGHAVGRTTAEQITLADVTQQYHYHPAIPVLALEKALFLGLGHRVH